MTVIVFRMAAVLAVVALASAPASATAQSSPTGEVVFDGGFETGNLSAWTGGQCANTGLPFSATSTRGTVNLTVRNAGAGKYAARFNLSAVTTSSACELLHKRPIGLGTDDYYGLMVFFPRNWREPSPAGWGLSIAQLSFQGIWGSPVLLAAHARSIALVVQTGLCVPIGSSHPGCTYTSGPGGNVKPMFAVRAPLALHVWHELIVHVHHAIDSSGVVEVWHRLKGESSWKKTVSLHGYPTVQWTPEGMQLAPGGRLMLSFNATVDKIGAYRGPADFPLSVWEDGFVRATSFAAAAAALP